MGAVLMNKAFTKEDTHDAEDEEEAAAAAAASLSVAGGKNYVTPAGYERLRAELLNLMDEERPKVVEIVSWAASNGDRSENGDYLYGKKRLREIDRRIRFLTKRLGIAVVVDPSVHHGSDQVFFGARVTFENDAGDVRTVTIKGVDEVDPLAGEISWVSPVAKALLSARIGDSVYLQTPAGPDHLSVSEVRYPDADKGFCTS
jgi:transcription elongation factor GreB